MVAEESRTSAAARAGGKCHSASAAARLRSPFCSCLATTDPPPGPHARERERLRTMARRRDSPARPPPLVAGTGARSTHAHAPGRVAAMGELLDGAGASSAACVHISVPAIDSGCPRRVVQQPNARRHHGRAEGFNERRGTLSEPSAHRAPAMATARSAVRMPRWRGHRTPHRDGARAVRQPAAGNPRPARPGRQRAAPWDRPAGHATSEGTRYLRHVGFGRTRPAGPAVRQGRSVARMSRAPPSAPATCSSIDGSKAANSVKSLPGAACTRSAAARGGQGRHHRGALADCRARNFRR